MGDRWGTGGGGQVGGRWEGTEVEAEIQMEISIPEIHLVGTILCRSRMQACPQCVPVAECTECWDIFATCTDGA